MGAKTPIKMNLIQRMTCFCIFNVKLIKIQIRKLKPKIYERTVKQENQETVQAKLMEYVIKEKSFLGFLNPLSTSITPVPIH